MENYINDYLSFFTLQSGKIKDAVEQCVEYWFPETPPEILLFSKVGRALATQLLMLSTAEKNLFFQYIESGICSENDKLATAVATGLIESMVTASDENDELWKEMEICLQPESKKHALAWKNFGQ
jgi:hypothetical protein